MGKARAEKKPKPWPPVYCCDLLQAVVFLTLCKTYWSGVCAAWTGPVPSQYIPPPPAPLLSTLWGVITDCGTNLPISGAKVSLDGVFAITDSNGIYSLQNIEPGNYTVTISKE